MYVPALLVVVTAGYTGLLLVLSRRDGATGDDHVEATAHGDAARGRRSNAAMRERSCDMFRRIRKLPTSYRAA